MAKLLPIDFFSTLNDGPEDDGTPCIGMIFRGCVSTFWTGNRYVTHKELRLLKRKSCKKEFCLACEAVDHYISESYPTEEVCDIENGKLYTLVLVDTSGATECGWEYDCALEIMDYKEPKAND